MSRHRWYLRVLVLFCGVAGAYFAISRWKGQPAIQTAALAVPAANATIAAPSAIEKPAPVPTQQGTSWHLSTAMVDKLRERRELQQRKNTEDEAALARSLLPAAQAGDTEAQMMLAWILTDCMFLDHRYRSGKTERDYLLMGETGPGRQDYLMKQLIACDALRAMPGDKLGTREEWLRRAAEGGDGRALMQRASEAEGMSIDARIADFHRAIASADPDVLRAIAGLYFIPSPPSADADAAQEARDAANLGRVAMDLADCSLGQDCSAQALAADCKNEFSSFDCSYADSVSDYYQRHLSAADFAQANALAKRLTDDFVSGSYDWPEAKAYEEGLRKPRKRRSAG
jgi:hypothetical protein